MRNYILILTCVSLLTSTGFGQAPARDAAQRRAELLKRFPQSDTNGDGVLSTQEIGAFIRKRRMEQGEQNGTPRGRLGNRPQVEAPVANVAYGEHKLQRFDLWPVPDAKGPTPLVIFIHGGGFRGGDKSQVRSGTIEKLHQAGIAFAAMNYRLSDSGPYPIMMHDAARGLQTIRHRAAEWNIDPDRVACYGGSAGAGISMWLAFHDDLADPNSNDPIARQSTRILAAGSTNGQSAYDMHVFRDWFEVPDLEMGPALPAFLGIEDESELKRPEIHAKMKDASPIAHLTKDDQAPVYMLYSRPNSKVTKETSHSIWVHHVLMGLKLQQAMEKLGLECVVTAPDLPRDTKYGSLEDFLIAKLKAEKPGK
ncbi:alpha/beta hydrolase [Bremerella sp. P1]|uniref:alpha/beta hydrolase n=1 Tax=Bremerella sp. P1 TaxID=3026424 RepID=UPI0023689FA1|nr:alpha/beta hydrolase [Bremerella sp. P1]WDI44207.1 alpha/beta hydrolase [Bremerella sp. P1]